ncbi:MAG: 16S rRNA (guanine(966)-N(2))-methyltransferase RsmD [Desulfuromonadales bacterium]|nr:16S rRNA (guanine(966)-N(2))-methyltransferase RsmD [Desulfuromonadales bacterium]
MRVIGGTARGRRLASFAGRNIRPTPDRVREALFNILYSRCGALSGCKVLDLFAGSGALGIEALSRGADHAWFADSSRESVGILRENLERCGFSAKATVVIRDILGALPMVAGAGPFDVIFADPPYSSDHAAKLLNEIDRHRLLGSAGVLCLETAVSDPAPSQTGTLALFDQRRYGSTMIHFYHLHSEEQA